MRTSVSTLAVNAVSLTVWCLRLSFSLVGTSFDLFSGPRSRVEWAGFTWGSPSTYTTHVSNQPTSVPIVVR